MKKLIYTISTVALLLISGCGDDFLDTQNLFEKSLENYYQTPTDID